MLSAAPPSVGPIAGVSPRADLSPSLEPPLPAGPLRIFFLSFAASSASFLRRRNSRLISAPASSSRLIAAGVEA